VRPREHAVAISPSAGPRSGGLILTGAF
jgi:hypothetical protein